MKSSKKIKRKPGKKNIAPYLFIAPNFIGMILFIMMPMLFSLVISFTDFNLFQGFQKTEFVGLNNYIEMFSDDWFIASVKNNLLYSLVTIPLCMIFSILIAVSLNSKIPFNNFLKALFFLPYMASTSVIAAIWLQLLNPSQGIINQILRFVGIANPPGWIGSLQWALPAIMLVGFWMNLGYNVIIYMAGLAGVPTEIYESARIDGANRIQLFIHITIPLVRNTTFFLIITNIVSSFQVFGIVNIMTDGGPGTATTVLAQYIYRAGLRNYKMGYASSMAWFLLLVIFAITLIQWQFQKKSES